MSHPYKVAPPTAFWRSAVSDGFDPGAVPGDTLLLSEGDVVCSAGSCFAANLVPYIEAAGYRYIRRGHIPARFGAFAEDNFSYSKFSAPYGNIYTVRHLCQLILRATRQFAPSERYWLGDDGSVVDPYRPGLRYPARSFHEFDVLTAQFLDSVLEVFKASSVFVFTLGLTEAWMSRADGAVFPACPGTVAGEFDPERHGFHNFTVGETLADLVSLHGLLKAINPALRTILTVSPVPLVATATEDHVLAATTYSKSVLRAAAGEAAAMFDDVTYFPAYELVTGPQAPASFFEDNRREPSEAAIDTVMSAFLSRCEGGARAAEAPLPASAGEKSLSALLSEAACEEAAAGR